MSPFKLRELGEFNIYGSSDPITPPHPSVWHVTGVEHRQGNLASQPNLS